MAIEFLRNIKKVEEQAQDILNQSHEEARNIVKQAREYAEAQHEEMLLKNKQEVDELISSALKRAEDTLQRARMEAENECAGIKSVSESNMDKAIDYIMGRII